MTRTRASCSPRRSAAPMLMAWALQLPLPTAGLLLVLERLWAGQALGPYSWLLGAASVSWLLAAAAAISLPRGRRWLARNARSLLAGGGGLLVALATAEAGLALLAALARPPGAPDVVPSAEFGWALVPGQAEVAPHGWRGAERPRAKSPGTLRIAAIGDSTTFGMHVRGEESWPAQLEAILGADPAWSKQFARTEVLNFGVPGYGAGQAYIALRDHAMPCAPDVVIYHLCANDFEDLAMDRSTIGRGPSAATLRRPRFTVEGVRPQRAVPSAEVPEVQRPSLLRRTQLLRVILSALPTAPHGPLLRFEPGEAEERLLWALVRAMQEESERRGALFLVTLSPTLLDRADPSGEQVERFRRRLREQAEESGVSLFDWMDEYRAAGGDEAFVLAFDPFHLGPDGNRFIAKRTAAMLIVRLAPGGSER